MDDLTLFNCFTDQKLQVIIPDATSSPKSWKLDFEFSELHVLLHNINSVVKITLVSSLSG